jgi:hypothetical protein
MLDQGAAGGGDLSGGQLDGGTMTPQEGDVDVQIEQVLVILVNNNCTIINYLLFLPVFRIRFGSGFSQVSGSGKKSIICCQ